MVIIATLVIVSFAVWGPRSYLEGKGGDVLFEFHGRKITREEQQRLSNKVGVYEALNCGYYEALATGDREHPNYPPPEDDYDYSVLNAMVFEHAADEMGIGATEQELAEEISRIPGYQTEGKFDPTRLDRFIQRALQPNGFSKDSLDMFSLGSIRMRKVKELLASTATVTPAEVQGNLIERNQLTEASYVAFKKTDFLAGTAATEDEMKQRYEAKKEQLKTDELRKVHYVSYQTPAPADPAKPATGVEKTKLLQPCVNAAYDLVQAIKKGGKLDEIVATQKADFEKRKANGEAVPVITVGDTEPFTSSDAPEVLEDMPEAAAAVFDLTKEKSTTPHLIGQKGAYVAQLLDGGITEPKQRTYEECKADLEGQIRAEKADEALRKKAEEIQKKIVEAKKAGKSFTEACEAAGVKAEALPAYSQAKRPQGPNGSGVAQAAAKLAPGDVSEFVPTQDGGLIVHVDQRPVVDEKSLAAEQTATMAMLENRRSQAIFREWLKERRHAAGLIPKKPVATQG